MNLAQNSPFCVLSGFFTPALHVTNIRFPSDPVTWICLLTSCGWINLEVEYEISRYCIDLYLKENGKSLMWGSVKRRFLTQNVKITLSFSHLLMVVCMYAKKWKQVGILTMWYIWYIWYVREENKLVLLKAATSLFLIYEESASQLNQLFVNANIKIITKLKNLINSS